VFGRGGALAAAPRARVLPLHSGARPGAHSAVRRRVTVHGAQ
jgi:hypothetical protein